MAFLVHFIGFLLSLLLSAFSSGTETGLYRTSRVRMRALKDKGDRRAGLVLKLLDRLDSLVTTILITNNIANYAGTYFLATQLMAWRVPSPEVATTLILTPIFFILGESLPKQMAYNHANELTHFTAPVVEAVRLLFAPAVWIINTVSAALRRLIGVKGNVEIAASERAKLIEYFEAGVADKVITEEQNRMARRIMELESISASDVMIPNGKLLLLQERISRAKAVSRMAESDAELVLLTDGAGRPTGKIVTLNILIRNPGNPGEPAANLAANLGRIKSGSSLPEVLLWLKREHAQRAAVTSRGRIIGVITTKSILDKIAGM